MDSVMKWLGPILGVVGPIIGSLMGASPLGLIAVGIGGLVLGGVVFFLYARWKKFVFDQAHKIETEQAAKDQQNQIKNNQQQSVGDAATIEQGEKDKQAAIAELTKPKVR